MSASLPLRLGLVQKQLPGFALTEGDPAKRNETQRNLFLDEGLASGGVRIFPYVLVRVGGRPFEELEDLRLKAASQLASERYALQSQLAEVKEQVSAALYPIVPTLPAGQARVHLIKFRRDVFNERPVLPDDLDLLRPWFTPTAATAIQHYVDLRERLQQCEGAGAAAYQRERAEARAVLQRLAQSDTLQRGLVLSSQSLLQHGLPHYLQHITPVLDKREAQTELSLMKYLSRIYAKTSPFSTFTHLALGRLSDTAGNEPLQLATGDQPTVTSQIRLNNFLFAYLQILLQANPEIYRQLRLRPNPTLQMEQGRYCFLANSHNVESFQRIPRHPVLELFQALTSEPRSGAIYGDVVNAILAGGYVDAPEAAIESYVNELLQYGFLEFNLGVSGIDPDWDLALRRQLQPLCTQAPVLNELCETLAQMRVIAQQYGPASSTLREQFLHTTYECFRDMALKLHAAAGLPAEERVVAADLSLAAPNGAKPIEDEHDAVALDGEEVFRHQAVTSFSFKPEQMLYEDALAQLSPRLATGALQTLASALNELWRQTSIFEGLHDERARMYAYFVSKYAPDATIKLLTFYEDYYRDVKKPEAERLALLRKRSGQRSHEDEMIDEASERSVDQDPPHWVAALHKRQELRKVWLREFAALGSPSMASPDETIDVTLAHIRRTNERLQLAVDHAADRGSHGVFVQFFNGAAQKADTLMGVLNAAVPGFGRLLSRFLHLFDDEVTADVRAWNRSLAQDELFAESSDASYFNANLHPALMPYEIWTPGGHTRLPAEQQIAVTEIVVRADDGRQQLRLIHGPSQKPVYTFNLGFQNNRGRSQLFQLLERFSLVQYCSWDPLVMALNESQRLSAESHPPSNGIWKRPRIRFEGRWIIQRQAWLVPRADLPLRQRAETDWNYFARVNEWRLGQGMPEEVFVSITDLNELQNLSTAERGQIRRDDYKPQYICFNNAFLVNLFERLVERVPHMLRVEEMLPDSKQLLQIGTHRHVAEFLVQWYSAPNPSQA